MSVGLAQWPYGSSTAGASSRGTTARPERFGAAPIAARQPRPVTTIAATRPRHSRTPEAEAAQHPKHSAGRLPPLAALRATVDARSRNGDGGRKVKDTGRTKIGQKKSVRTDEGTQNRIRR